MIGQIIGAIAICYLLYAIFWAPDAHDDGSKEDQAERDYWSIH